MNNLICYFLFTFIMLGSIIHSEAQTAMQFTGTDCIGNSVDLYADLDAGNAVVLFYYMANCASCPPPAQKIKLMADRINNNFPGKVKAYAYPFTNTTTCAYSVSWVNSNNLSPLYAPMDSGAMQVAYYGGFGMPTVVLLGGMDHRVMFSTLSFVTSDTTIMRDSILALLNSTGIQPINSAFNDITVYPNPASSSFMISIETLLSTNVRADLEDISGKQVSVLLPWKEINGTQEFFIDASFIPDGDYFIRIYSEDGIITRKVQIAR